MKRLLPILFSLVIALTVFLSPAVALISFAAAPITNTTNPATDSRWVIDPEVTFIGKNARRSGDFLDWTLQNYNWVCVKQISSGNGNVQCDNTNNPIEKYWSLIVLYIVVPMLFVVILATSIVIIVTRGKSLTIMRFIPRFIAVVLLIVFSYSLLQFFYQFTDLIQGFFLRSNINQPCPPTCISDKDLLYVGWDYTNFVGLRLLGDKYAESAFISLLLTKLTALTYFVMVFLLLVRKIILWFFIIVSPIFPILLLYYPVRNTGKIWIGEFFRWLLYAPLFAIFLNGLVYLWRNQIPLVFNNPNIGNAAAIEYPTAVNILLGGPRQQVTPTNSVNLPETFALYVVSLIMLWIVILLPWILLQIFLDYAQNFAPGDTAVMKTLVNMATSPKGSGPSPAPAEGGGGAAIALPFAKKFNIPTNIGPGPTGAAKELKIENVTANQATFNRPALISTAEINNANVNASVLNTANVKLPSMRDIARYDMALRSTDQSKQQEVNKFAEQLTKIGNPVVVTNTIEKDRYREIREKIGQQSRKGNIAANNVMNAAKASSSSLNNVSNQKVKSMLQQMANPNLAKGTDKEKMTQLNSMLKNESTKSSNKTSATSKDQISSQLASSILKVNDKTSDKEVQKIKDQLNQASSSSVSKSVTSAITQSARSTSQMQETIKQIANPTSVTKVEDKARVEQLRGTLQKASSEGNTLATSILSVNDKTSVTEIEALQARIQQAKDKGEPLATELSNVAKTTNVTTLPTVNKVQTVKKEDYQAVKDMWKQNYQNLEVPQGMAGSRSEWIKDDIKSIDETIALLSSPDQDKQQQGMDQVSNLLPFLLVGGFSQNEIVDYLKAKQDAAKEVSTSIAAEEEEKVSVTTRATHAAQTMAATMTEDTASSAPSAGIPTNSTSDDNEESPLSNISAAATAMPSSVQTAGALSSDSFSLTELAKPKITDIAKLEVRHLTKDKVEAERYDKMKEILKNIANPANSLANTDHVKFEDLRKKLADASQKGDIGASSILSAANITSDQPNASQVSDLPEGQGLSKEQYEEVKKLWEENYKTLPVPEGFTSDTAGRVEWITKDSTDTQEVADLLQSSDKAKNDEAMKKISGILPFLLLGGFSRQEMTGYLQAKLDAAKASIQVLNEEEASKVAVTEKAGEIQQEKIQEVEEKPEEQ